jgi:hypothetical protein
MREVPKAVHRPLGRSVDLVTTVPVSPAHFGAMEDATYNVDDFAERAVVGEWTRRVATGHVDNAYVALPITQTTKKPFRWPTEPKQQYTKRKPKPPVTQKDIDSWDPKADRTPDFARVDGQRQAASKRARGEGREATWRQGQ